MSAFIKISSFILLAVIVFAQPKGDTADSNDTSKASVQQSSNGDDDGDIIGELLQSIFGTKETNHDSNAEYDYFQDKNGNGVDDRLEKKNTSKKATDRSSSSKKKNSKRTTKRTKTTKRRGR